MKIRLFIKPTCGWCRLATDWLNARGIQYELIDVFAQRGALQEMVNLSGQQKSPVIEVDGKVLADFGPEELEAFWETNFNHR
ncbi:MAG: hypothetical protein RLZZ350_197 [Verrucomicrobiota bacterium]|jgi:arsenate reductase-like glutaredoxin family protein